MRFLYVFSLMFLSIFGLAVLIHLFIKALTDGASRKFEVYVRYDENIEELLANISRNPNIGRVYVIAGSDGGNAERAAGKYSDVKIIKDAENKDDETGKCYSSGRSDTS